MRVVVAAIALLAIAVSTWQLVAARDGLTILETRVGSIPVTVFEPGASPAGRSVVIAHGFTGSQQLMQPFAVTLARNGYRAITFDFPGHGRNPAPLPGGIERHEARSDALLDSLAKVVEFARESRRDAPLALLAHSMGADIVVRHAIADHDVAATVAVSLFSRAVTPERPRNLLIIDGALEPAPLRDAGMRIVGMAANGAARPNVTYGAFADGTARRFALAPNVEHIGVLYSRTSLDEAVQWIDAAFGHRGTGFVDARGPWLGLLYLGLVALAWPLSRLLPRVASPPAGASLPWRWLLPVAVAPALLTPLLLWRAPTDFLPILLGDYLALHFALYGALTAAGGWIVRRRGGAGAPARPRVTAFVVAAAAATLYATLALGLPTDEFVTSAALEGTRLTLALVMIAATLPYFAADEWLTRGPGAPRGAYAATKALFLLSLAIAVGLNLKKLFFLAIILPPILAFFVVYGLFSRWTYARTGYPLVAAMANAAAFGAAIAATFPIVAR